MKHFKLAPLLVLVSSIWGTSTYAQAPVAGAAISQDNSASANSADSTGPMTKENPSDALQENAKKGWFFYEHPKKPPPEVVSSAPETPSAAPPPKEDRCKKMESWSSDCGFVNPGTSFEFQSKERDALLQGMAMSQNDPKKVEAFQYYQKWVLDRSIEIANLWYYNTVQNPELDANVKSPINTFGLKLMTEVKDSSQASIIDALKHEDAFYVYFSRHDCTFCNAMAPVLNQLKKDSGLEVWNAALDKTCMAGYEAKCLSGEAVQAPAQALQVSIVPTLFLYVPPNTWIRVATGLTDEDTVRARTTTFFSAYRTALIKGVQNTNAGVAPVDFSASGSTGTAAGSNPATGPVRVPTEDELKSLLNK